MPGALGILETAAEEVTPAVGAAVSVAVRPEKLSLSHRKGSNGNSIPGTISAQAYFGDRSHYFVSVPGVDRLVAVAMQNVERSLKGSGVGQRVWLTWPPEAGVLLAE